MRLSPRHLAVTAAVALAAPISAPAAGAAESPCRAVVSPSTGSEIAIVLEGHYTYSGPHANISDARLTCHIVQNGVRVVSVTDPFEGPTAALLSDERIDAGPFSICYSLDVLRILGPQPSDYPSSSDC
ncbi:MAG TPA: hypothetical protein VG318_17685 [Actinomycetota bacterium]|nr:hypothetical protein [Actinomycetota bacterium]